MAMKRPLYKQQEETNRDASSMVLFSHNNQPLCRRDVLFAGHTPRDFQRARLSLIRMFKLEGCWDFVKPPESPTDPIVESDEGMFCSHGEPSEKALNQRLQRLREETAGTLASRLAALRDNILRGNNHAYKSVEEIPHDHPEIMHLRSDSQRIELIREDAIIESYERSKWLDDWNYSVDRFDAKRKACDKIFRTVLSEDVQCLIEEELMALAYRAAWKKLHELYDCPFDLS